MRSDSERGTRSSPRGRNGRFCILSALIFGLAPALSAAGLFLGSSLRAARVEPGFQIDHEVIVELDPSLVAYNQTRGCELYRTLLTRVRAMPGVQSASLAATVPFGTTALGNEIQCADAPLRYQRSAAAAISQATIISPLFKFRCCGAAAFTKRKQCRPRYWMK